MSDKQQVILVFVWAVSLFLVGLASARFGFFLGAEAVYSGDVICESALNEWVCELSKVNI